MAIHADRPVYPVAHNAGECWQHNGLIKTPGTVTVSIGPRIEVTGKTPEQVTKEVEDWLMQSVQSCRQLISFLLPNLNMRLVV